MRRLVLVALLAAACAKPGPQSAREAYDALQFALSPADGKALLLLLDEDSLWYRRGRVREWRALVARGEIPRILEDYRLTPEEVSAGTEDDAVALMLQRNFPLAAEKEWYDAAEFVAEESDGPDSVLHTLRGANGELRQLWFFREQGRWRYDMFRSRRLW